ncbi:hypothetical protein EW146_g7070 [Bondarzewia mesenterica]|uniref:Uncharacterized protein n=1 Tax=Bondarzewia mesenterica TaxID=1095465 RepID=A0A4S4LMK4_9AGAM|nr:hypothetical protein EW146_g7070 [Bondarzewia mesenterica]
MQDEALEEAAAKALEIFEAITEEGHRQAMQEAAAEADWDEAAWQMILKGLAEAQWEASQQEVEELAMRQGQQCPAPPLPASRSSPAPPHEDASTNTSPIPQSPTSFTTYMHLPRLMTPSPDQTYATPSFIERFDLPIVVMKIELTPEGVIHYGHPTTALLVHPPPLLTDNTIMAEKDFHDAIMSLEQYA